MNLLRALLSRLNEARAFKDQDPFTEDEHRLLREANVEARAVRKHRRRRRVRLHAKGSSW